MERHRDEERLTLLVQMPRHEARHRLGDAGPAAIFELERHLPGNVAISDRGAEAIEARRMGGTAGADPLGALAIIEQQGADRAAGLAEEVELRPAGIAEAVRRLDDQAAGGAARRQ